MAEKLGDFPTDGRLLKSSKYPWGEWSDGSVWRIRRGEDYQVATSSMISNLYIAARRMGMKARVSIPGDRENRPMEIVFQFQPKEG